MEAHTQVDVIVDLKEFKDLLDSRLPLVFNGTSIEDAAMPWPRIINSSLAHRDDYGEEPASDLHTDDAYPDLPYEDLLAEALPVDGHPEADNFGFCAPDSGGQTCQPEIENSDLDAATLHVKHATSLDESLEETARRQKRQPRRGDGSLHD